jgi:hypothetical protein
MEIVGPCRGHAFFSGLYISSWNMNYFQNGNNWPFPEPETCLSRILADTEFELFPKWK